EGAKLRRHRASRPPEASPAARSTGFWRTRMLKATQLRPGMIIVHEGDLYTVHSVDHRTPGNKRGAMATRMRSLRSGSIIDYRFRAEDFVERAVLDEIEFQYLYADGEGYHFMNNESFEQIHVSG